MNATAVSVDLDELRHYRAIHGLSTGQDGAVFRLAIPRALAWAHRNHLPLTFFVVTSDLASAANKDILRTALREGHAVESHSSSHPYDLVRRPPDEIRREVGGSFDAIEETLGVRPRGFRAPGYTLSNEVLDAVEEAGGLYDASSLPSPSYYFAKLAALGAIAQAGRRSSSIVGPVRGTLGPTQPYRPQHRAWWKRGQRPLLEIPMFVTRGPRLPIIGTSLGLAGRHAARLVRAGLPAQCVSLELHGIDFLDVSDGVQDLKGHQPELAKPLAVREQAYDAAIGALRDAGHVFVTLPALTSLCT